MAFVMIKSEGDIPNLFFKQLFLVIFGFWFYVVGFDVWMGNEELQKIISGVAYLNNISSCSITIHVIVEFQRKNVQFKR